MIAVGGDGDGYGEGGNHLIHTIRRNMNITYLIHNNQIYGLTKGQASPTSDKGFIGKTTPGGVLSEPLNPIALAIALGITFVARGFSGRISHLVNLIVEGINHNGFALIDILQPCVSFNRQNTYSWYKKRVYNLEDEGDYDASNKLLAFKKAQEWGEKIPIGIIYRSKSIAFESNIPALKEGPLVKQTFDPLRITDLLQEFIP